MKRRLIEVKWGLIFVIMFLLWVYFEKLMGWHNENIAQHAIYTNLVAIPSVLVYVLALRDKRKNHLANIMTWKQGFVSGLFITLLVLLLTPFSQLVTLKIISPEYFDHISSYVVRTNKMTAIEAQNHFNLQNYILQASMATGIAGATTSAIVALFVRREG